MIVDDDKALLWATRRDSGPLNPDDQRAFAAWVSENPRHEGALLRAEAALSYLNRGRALAPLDTAPDIAEPRAWNRRAFLAGGMLCTVGAMELAGFLIAEDRGDVTRTAVGEVRPVALADGSVATLNTASRIAVAMRPEARMVHLEDGEAWFQVAKDKKRPFVVDAGHVRVRAVGTAFSVRRRPEGVDVLVTEGVVETWLAGHETAPVRIAAGMRSFIPDDGTKITATKAGEQIDRVLAWRHGGLALSGESLAYAAAEMNRYNRRKLVIDDALLGQESVVGYFRTDEPDNFAQTVAAVFGANVDIVGEEIHISPGEQ